MNFIFKIVPVLLAALALIACSGGGRQGQGQTGSAGGNGDPFIAAVQQLSATSPEDAEPADVDAVTVTTPESAEPVDAG